MRKFSVLLISCIYMCMLLFCIPANALSGQNSLTLHYYAINEALPLANATFYIYRVAEPLGDGSYALTEDFSQYQVDLSDLDWNEAGRLTQLAITLSAYAARDDIAPLDMKMTDSKGDLTFAGLADGLYLVWGDMLTVAVDDTDWNFTPQPLLLPLPYVAADGIAVNDMEVDVKYDRFPPPTMDDLIDLTVKKVWEHTDTPPGSVTIQLMRNGIITDSTVLNEENNWQYTWKNLNSGYVWQVTEKDVPDGYSVSVHQEGYVFTITNTGSGRVTGTTATAVTGTTTTHTTGILTGDVTSADTETANATVSTERPNTAAAAGMTKLPQTGQLWWPVPILSGTGFILLGIGLLLRRKEE